MSAPNTRTIIWAGGEDQFCLSKVGLILDLEEKCKAGLAVVVAKLETGAWGLNDVRETIRLGLIGGGMSPEKAMAAVHNHVDVNPLASSVLLAYHIARDVLFGVPDDTVGKTEPAGAENPGSIETTDASDDLK